MRHVTLPSLSIMIGIIICLISSRALALSPQEVDLNANTIPAMKDQLVNHVMLDGSVLKDVQAVNSCSTKFITLAGSSTIDWTMVINPVAEIDATQYLLPITTPTSTHKFSAPKDKNGDDLDERMVTILDTLYYDCHDG